MKNTAKTAVFGTVSALTFSLAASSAVLAAGSDKCGGDNVAVANVIDSLLIRESESESSKVIGYVPSAAGVIVESMDSEWTKIQIGDTSGYVKTEYLAFDEEAEELKSVYGVLGAVASWDDVKVFSDYEDTSSVIGTLQAGEGYEILGSTENWVEIQLSSGDTAYVAAEDVDTTLVLETPVALDEAVEMDGNEDSSSGDAYIEESYADTTYTDSAYTDTNYYTDSTYTDTTYTDSAYTDTTYTDSTYTDTTYTDTAYTDSTYTDTTYTDTTYTDSTYTDTTYTDSTYTDTTYTDSTYTDTTYTDSTYTTETETAETQATETEAASTTTSSASASDTELLAALIYCEAGNQSYEGMVAVGQVVMNRVASSSFPNTIREVIYESGQFTPASSGWLESVLGSVPDECYQAAVDAINGGGTVGDALYFNTGSGKGVKIGDHQFY